MKHLRGYDFYAAPNLLFFFQKAMAAWVDMLFTAYFLLERILDYRVSRLKFFVKASAETDLTLGS
ncbi:hypothetical protein [Akkermansia massiliensis]|uniref:hypothetical protein n=1 Tax=Akkermansia massiliensis TaxID=2927224 RepID=UPI00202F103D|nr:hypothetical protein [Akkermansia sp. B2-R-115]